MKLLRPFLLVPLFVLLYNLPCLAGPCGDFVHRPDEPGKVKVKVEKGGYEKYYRLTRAEDAAFNAHLKKILDIILEQPCLKPPRGTELRGWLRNWHSQACLKEPCRGVPVVGQGKLYFHRLLEGSNGKVFPIIEADGSLSFSINDLEEALGRFRTFGRDSRGRLIMVLPEPYGDINGAALFRKGGWRTEIVVIARGDRPWWAPVSREEFLRASIRDLEKEAAKMGTISSAPNSDLYRKWIAEGPKRRKEAEQMYRELKKTNPSAAETIREQSTKLEAEMTERFRQESEREAARAPRQMFNPLEARLQFHREVLKSMSPEERTAPAYYLQKENPLEPELAPPGSMQGEPLAVINHDYFDRSLPRTAIQIMTVRWSGPWVADPGWMGTCEGQVPSMLLMHETVMKTNWGAIRAVLGN